MKTCGPTTPASTSGEDTAAYHKGPWASFNIICNYLYYFHYDEYSWRFQKYFGDNETFSDEHTVRGQLALSKIKETIL